MVLDGKLKISSGATVGRQQKHCQQQVKKYHYVTSKTEDSQCAHKNT